MARKKIEKKCINVVNLALLDKLVKDKADMENRSESSVIEQCVIDSFLPENAFAKEVALNYLYADSGGVQKALVYLVCQRIRINFDLLPFIQFAVLRERLVNTALNGTEEKLCTFLKHFETVLEILEEYASHTENENSFFIQKDIDWIKKLMKDSKIKEAYLSKNYLIYFYEILLDSWNILENESLMYNILAELISLGDWSKIENCNTRLEFLKLLKTITTSKE